LLILDFNQVIIPINSIGPKVELKRILSNVSTNKCFTKMNQPLPLEIIDHIAYYLPFDKGIGISQYLKKKLGIKISKRPWREFAKDGNLFGLEWMQFHELGGCSTDAMHWASLNGHLNIVRWLHTNRTEGCTTFAMDYAARMGHLDTLNWLYRNRFEGWTTSALHWAAQNGHLSVVEWLKQNTNPRLK
jgi:hypothetical protein